MKWEGEVTVVHATAKAILVEYEGEEFWVPKSIVDDDSEIYSGRQIGESGVLVIPYNFACEKGLEG